MKKYVDIRVVGGEEELLEFADLCKIIQRLGRVGSNRDITITVDGDGSGRLSFYGIENGKFTEFNSEKIDVDDKDLMHVYIGE